VWAGNGQSNYSSVWHPAPDARTVVRRGSANEKDAGKQHGNQLTRVDLALRRFPADSETIKKNGDSSKNAAFMGPLLGREYRPWYAAGETSPPRPLGWH